MDVPPPPAPEPAVKPFECCRRHRFRPGTKASNTPNLEATTGQTPKELQSGFEFTGEEIDARDIAARPREGRDQTAPDRDPRRVPKTIRWASMPAASSRGRSAPTCFSTAGGSKLQLVSCSSNAKGLAAGLAPTSGQVVTQIQSASPRPVSAVRILYAQPRSWCPSAVLSGCRPSSPGRIAHPIAALGPAGGRLDRIGIGSPSPPVSTGNPGMTARRQRATHRVRLPAGGFHGPWPHSAGAAAAATRACFEFQPEPMPRPFSPFGDVDLASKSYEIQLAMLTTP